MPATRTIAISAALGMLTIATTAACSGIRNRLEDGVVHADPITAVSLAGGGGGDITVAVDPTVKGVDIRRTVRYLHQAPSIDDTVTFAGGVVTLKTDCGAQCDASYSVKVPAAGVKVTGSNGSGNLHLQDVSDVDVQLGSGDASVDHASGAVQLRTGSGNIEVSDVAGGVTVNSGSGDVSGTDLRGPSTTIELSSGNVSLDVPGTGDVKVVASSGDIDVLVPDHTCRVTVRSDSGDQSVEVSPDPASTHEMDLRTGSGNITVSRKV